MGDPFKEVKVTALENQTQVINVIEEHIRELELHLGEMPNPSDPVNSPRYIRWERLGMSWIGEVKGQLELSKLLGVITPEQHKRLHVRALAAITHLTAQMVMQGHKAR